MTRINLIVQGLLLSMLVACASNNTPEMDKQFGQAVRSTMAAQVINPNGTATKDPVTTIDAAAGVAAQQGYQDSYKAPPKTFDVFGGSR
jgi:type IV pilus biogenesis protein CpaD/CtpE